MSTILDALKKVERERQSPRGQLFHAPPLEAKRSRRLSPGVIAACAAVGFAAGIGLAVLRDTPPTDIAALPKLPPPPAIDIPAPPRLPEAAKPREIVPGEGTAPATQVEQQEQVAVPPPADAPQGQASSAASAAVPAEPPVPPAGVEAGQAIASAPSVAQPPVAAPPAPAVAAAPNVPAGPPSDALEVESALEPSPFAPARPADSLPAAAASRSETSEADLPPPVAQQPPTSDTVAALAPPEPAVAPDADLPSEGTEEPPPPPTTVIDTGRSPPGAPKVSLSFLQWSADPARRFAFVSIDGAPSQRVREGDSAGSLTVAEITPTGVQFKQDGKLFTIRPRH